MILLSVWRVPRAPEQPKECENRLGRPMNKAQGTIAPRAGSPRNPRSAAADLRPTTRRKRLDRYAGSSSIRRRASRTGSPASAQKASVAQDPACAGADLSGVGNRGSDCRRTVKARNTIFTLVDRPGGMARLRHPECVFGRNRKSLSSIPRAYMLASCRMRSGSSSAQGRKLAAAHWRPSPLLFALVAPLADIADVEGGGVHLFGDSS
jgi:hypothetical protein